MTSDTTRLDWLAHQDGAALVNDDFGNWAVSFDGMQNIPEKPGEPSDIATTFFIEAKQWLPSIREAIDAAMASQTLRPDDDRTDGLTNGSPS